MASVGFAAGLGIVAIEELDPQSGYDFFPCESSTHILQEEIPLYVTTAYFLCGSTTCNLLTLFYLSLFFCCCLEPISKGSV